MAAGFHSTVIATGGLLLSEGELGHHDLSFQRQESPRGSFFYGNIRIGQLTLDP